MMRSFYKIICGAAVAFLSLGLLLGAMGFLLGGRPGGLYEYSQSYKPAISSAPMKLAGCCILAVPILVLFFCFHNKIMGNVSMGGIKE